MARFGDEAVQAFAQSLWALGADDPPGGEAAITGGLALEEFPGGGITAKLALVGGA